MDRSDLPMETRMALAESDVAQLKLDQGRHEVVCGERWTELKRLIGWGGGVALSLLIGLAAWGLNRTWEGQQQQLRLLQELQRPPAAQVR